MRKERKILDEIAKAIVESETNELQHIEEELMDEILQILAKSKITPLSRRILTKLVCNSSCFNGNNIKASTI